MYICTQGCCGYDRMVVGFITTYAISAQLSSLTLCVRTSTNKADLHYITEILLKVPLNTIPLAPTITRISILPCLIMSKVFTTYNQGRILLTSLV